MLIDHRWGLVNSKLSLAESADMQPQKLVSADFDVAMGRVYHPPDRCYLVDQPEYFQ